MYYCDNCNLELDDIEDDICPICGAIVEDNTLSSCCGVPFYEETDICSACGEHG